MLPIVFQVSAKDHGTFAERLDSLYDQFKAKLNGLGKDVDHVVWTRLFLSDAANQLEEVLRHPLYTEALSQAAFSYVEQPPLDGCKVALMVGSTYDDIKKSGTPDRMVVECHGRRHLMQSIRFTAEEASQLTPKEQTKEAFRRHIQWLNEEGLTLKDNCMRTWFFVRDIDHNYQDVVEGRNEVFAVNGLTADTHFIASTGIAGNGDNGAETVCADFWSVDDDAMEVKYLQALEYLNPTHEYGVAFERGTAFTSDGTTWALISGTASIDKVGRCIHQGDVIRQCDRLFENIDQLLANAGKNLQNMTNMFVYLRDLSDYQDVKAYLDRRFPNVARMVVLAPVCRPAWLIEVECVAI